MHPFQLVHMCDLWLQSCCRGHTGYTGCPDVSDKYTPALVALRCYFFSLVPLHRCQLVLELAEGVEIMLDYSSACCVRSGWWFDEDISFLNMLTPIPPGNHLLEMTLRFNIHTKLERLYLLGEFAVQLRGPSRTIHALDLQEEIGCPGACNSTWVKCRTSAHSQ
jgi:hypothetical protein